MVDLASLPGMAEASEDVARAVQAFELTEVMEAPPDRKYRISKSHGINLLFDGQFVLAVQVYVEPKRKYQAFPGALPFGLRRGLARPEVRSLLGEPDKEDAFDTYLSLGDGDLKLVVDYGGTNTVQYLSIEASRG